MWENTIVVCFKVSSKHLLEGTGTNYRQFPSVFEEFCLLWHNALLAACFMLASCLDYFLTLKLEMICSSKIWLTFTGLYDLISEKVELFNWKVVSRIYDCVLKNLPINWQTILSNLLLYVLKCGCLSYAHSFLTFLLFMHNKTQENHCIYCFTAWLQE
jgi:hypothetical protein